MFEGQGRDFLIFPERGVILEHQTVRFAKMILRDRCSTWYDLASLFRGRRISLDRWSGKRIGTRPSALQSTFHFWRTSRRTASFLMLPPSNFWLCQVKTLRKSRRIAAFLTLSTSKIEQVSQNSFVFKLADRQKDRQLQPQLQLQLQQPLLPLRYTTTTTTTTTTNILRYITLYTNSITLR